MNGVPFYTPDEIASRRKALGMTQRALADRVGVSSSAYQQWESGGSTPSYSNRVKLYRIFDGLDDWRPEPTNRDLLNAIERLERAVAQLVAEKQEAPTPQAARRAGWGLPQNRVEREC